MLLSREMTLQLKRDDPYRAARLVNCLQEGLAMAGNDNHRARLTAGEQGRMSLASDSMSRAEEGSSMRMIVFSRKSARARAAAYRTKHLNQGSLHHSA